MINCHLSWFILSLQTDLVVRQSPDSAAWFDVGVFKTLFAEVGHYYLPADGDQAPSAVSSWERNTKEVKTMRCEDVHVKCSSPSRALFRLPSVDAAGASGLPGEGEAAAGYRADIQVQSCRHQLLWTWRFQPSQ